MNVDSFLFHFISFVIHMQSCGQPFVRSFFILGTMTDICICIPKAPVYGNLHVRRI